MRHAVDPSRALGVHGRARARRQRRRGVRPGPILLAGLCAAPVLLWANALPLGTRFIDGATSLTSMAVAFGLAGVSAFALNLVLGARLRVVASLFGGLERMYKAHQINGRIAFLLLAGHGLLIVASRAVVSLGSVTTLADFSAGWTIPLGIVALMAMAVSIFLTLYVRLNHEVFVYVQRSFGFVFMIAMLHVFMTPGTKAVSPSLTYYLATLSFAGVGAFAYRSLLADVLVRRHRYEVAAVNRLDEFVTEIVMTPLGRPLAFTAGQFVFVNLRSAELSKLFHPVSVESQGHMATFSFRPGEISNQFHPFSVTSAPGDGQLRITVKAVGDYTLALRSLEEGAEAIVEGPYGAFSFRNIRNRRQVWISGGIGLTPFLSMARSLGHDEGSIDLYYCVEHDNEAYFLDEFFDIAARNHNLRVIPIIRDREGFVSAERIEQDSGDLSRYDYLICGPPAMIVNLRAQLIRKGVPPARIHAEEFGFARLGHKHEG